MLAARVIAGIVVVLVWVLALVLPLGWAGYVAALGVTVLAGLTVYLYERYVARSGGVRRRELDAVVLACTRGATPTQQAALHALEEDFREAVTRMTGAIPGRSPRQALDAAPWFLVVGPPGVGKSSLLANSGLAYAWATAPTGPRGERACRWWLTADAVFVDTAGAWVAAEAARPEWLALLALTDKNRGRQPVDGVIVPVAADSLAVAKPEEIDALSRILRARLDEVTGYLGVDVPVHLVVTRADTVPGFWDFFGDLRDNDRAQVWGATFPPDPAPAGDRVGAAFDELLAVVTGRRLRRMATERDPARRYAAYQFPQWFAALRQNLTTLAASTFAHSVYQDPILLRGVYFTSAAGDPAARGNGPGGYFLRDLFRAVVVPDKALAARSVAEIRRRRQRRNAIAAGLAAVALLGSVLPAWSYAENEGVVTDLDAAVTAVGRPRTGPLPLADLDTLRSQVARLAAWHDQGPPLYARFGMYTGDRLYPRAATLFGALTFHEVGMPVVERRATELNAFAARYSLSGSVPTADEKTYYGDALRLYLFLTTPRMSDDASLSDATQRQWFTLHLAQAWGQANPAAQAVAWPAMNAIADLYGRLLESDARLAAPRDLGLVARVRAILART